MHADGQTKSSMTVASRLKHSLSPVEELAHVVVSLVQGQEARIVLL